METITNVQPHENIHLFAIDYIVTLWTCNEKREEEPVLFSIRDKCDQSDDFIEFYNLLDEAERAVIKQLLHDELKWCEETLEEESLRTEDFQEINLLKQAYEETNQILHNVVTAA